MSSTSSTTVYKFAFRVGMTEVDFQFSDTDGMTDPMAFQFADAFRALWPAGTDVSASVTKNTNADTVFTQDNSTTPPTFV